MDICCSRVCPCSFNCASILYNGEYECRNFLFTSHDWLYSIKANPSQVTTKLSRLAALHSSKRIEFRTIPRGYLWGGPGKKKLYNLLSKWKNNLWNISYVVSSRYSSPSKLFRFYFDKFYLLVIAGKWKWNKFLLHGKIDS